MTKKLPEQKISTPAVAEIPTETEKKSDAGAPVKAKKKSRKSVPYAKVFVQANYNNTIVSVADTNGNVLAAASSGGCGFKGSRKSTPYAAQIAAEKAMEKAESFGITEIDVYIKGVGAGRDQCLRGLITKGTVNILSIHDVTPIPHGGCRKKKARRI